MTPAYRFTGPIPPTPDLQFELPLWKSGVGVVAGLDEAGRGAWAGPVAAAAVILPPDSTIASRLHGVRDSKQMNVAQREVWAEKIKSQALAWCVAFSSNTEIDASGILPATRLAMQRALAGLALQPAHLLIDAVRLPQVDLPQTPLIKGDQRALSIAAASVLAKTARDALMAELEQQFPGYGFARHKGYGTRSHQASLARLGACPAHRFSFAPIKKIVFLTSEPQ